MSPGAKTVGNQSESYIKTFENESSNEEVIITKPELPKLIRLLFQSGKFTSLLTVQELISVINVGK